MLLDPATASVATGVPVRTIQRWVLAGRIIDHGDGVRITVDVDEVQQLADLRATRRHGRLPSGSTVAYLPCQPGRTVTSESSAEAPRGR